MLVLNRANLAPKQIMYVRERGKSDNSEIPREITEYTAKELLSLPDSLAIAYENSTARSLHSFNKYVAYDINTQESTNRYLQECAALSSLFDDESFISVPYRQQGVTSGRIFLSACNSS
jgi:hypothetical protein